METKRLFDGQTDRYAFDFGLCTTKKGFAQIDTSQDASYFGTWINPFRKMIVCYCEGDVTIQTAEDDAELVKEIETMKQWNNDNGHGFYGIDAGLNETLEQGLIEVGLKSYLH